MPVIDQIAEASEKFFDAADENNTRAKEATVAFVHRVQENDFELPFADRMPAMPTMPFADRLPAADEAVATGFDFVATGIEANRNLVHRVIERFGVEVEVPAAVTPAKKSTAKKTTAKKAPAKKTTAKKSTAKKATAKKATAKK